MLRSNNFGDSWVGGDLLKLKEQTRVIVTRWLLEPASCCMTIMFRLQHAADQRSAIAEITFVVMIFQECSLLCGTCRSCYQNSVLVGEHFFFPLQQQLQSMGAYPLCHQTTMFSIWGKARAGKETQKHNHVLHLGQSKGGQGNTEAQPLECDHCSDIFNLEFFYPVQTNYFSKEKPFHFHVIVVLQKII